MFKVYVSNYHDPYVNQAIESQFFYGNEEMVLMLYVNDPCVVIGRNQNPWIEVKSYKDIPIVRRISGGGTVYHDRGNVNYAFIYNKNMSSVEKNFDYIISSMKKLDIDLHLTDRKDLFYGDYKVSGNAFYRRGNRRLHHGTMLIDVQVKDLWQYLRFDRSFFECRSIPSVKSPIMNLKEVKHDLTAEHVIDVLSGELTVYSLDLLDDSFLDKYRTMEWIYGETPDFLYQSGDHVIEVSEGRMTSDLRCIDKKWFDEELIKEEVKNVSRII